MTLDNSTPRQIANCPQPAPLDYVSIYNDRYIRNTGSPVKTYLVYTGLWQYWDMFSPNPSNLDVWVDAEIEYSDGTRSIYQYPRMYLMSPQVKYFKERYRKFLERAHTEDNSKLWPFFAARIAREARDKEHKTPVKLVLRRHFRTYQGPNTLIPPFKTYNYYTYTVKPEDLQS